MSLKKLKTDLQEQKGNYLICNMCGKKFKPDQNEEMQKHTNLHLTEQEVNREVYLMETF